MHECDVWIDYLLPKFIEEVTSTTQPEKNKKVERTKVEMAAFNFHRLHKTKKKRNSIVNSFSLWDKSQKETFLLTL